jgi:hypothetical protein
MFGVRQIWRRRILKYRQLQRYMHSTILYKLDIDQNNVSQLSTQHGLLNQAGLLLASY